MWCGRVSFLHPTSKQDNGPNSPCTLGALRGLDEPPSATLFLLRPLLCLQPPFSAPLCSTVSAGGGHQMSPYI